LQAIQESTDKPVRFLLHSHNHWDHASGGQVFKDAGKPLQGAEVPGLGRVRRVAGDERMATADG